MNFWEPEFWQLGFWQADFWTEDVEVEKRPDNIKWGSGTVSTRKHVVGKTQQQQRNEALLVLLM